MSNMERLVNVVNHNVVVLVYAAEPKEGRAVGYQLHYISCERKAIRPKHSIAFRCKALKVFLTLLYNLDLFGWHDRHACLHLLLQ